MVVTTPLCGGLGPPWRAAWLFHEACDIQGLPAGGVLSPLLWCSMVDDLLGRLSGNGVFIQGYADHICLLAVGKFLNTVSDSCSGPF